MLNTFAPLQIFSLHIKKHGWESQFISAANVFKHVREKQTQELIVDELQLIFSDYGINDKVVSVVTDNATNFVAAFMYTYQFMKNSN